MSFGAHACANAPWHVATAPTASTCAPELPAVRWLRAGIVATGPRFVGSEFEKHSRSVHPGARIDPRVRWTEHCPWQAESFSARHNRNHTTFGFQPSTHQHTRTPDPRYIHRHVMTAHPNECNLPRIVLDRLFAHGRFDWNDARELYVAQPNTPEGNQLREQLAHCMWADHMAKQRRAQRAQTEWTFHNDSIEALTQRLQAQTQGCAEVRRQLERCGRHNV